MTQKKKSNFTLLQAKACPPKGLSINRKWRLPKISFLHHNDPSLPKLDFQQRPSFSCWDLLRRLFLCLSYQWSSERSCWSQCVPERFWPFAQPCSGLKQTLVVCQSNVLCITGVDIVFQNCAIEERKHTYGL